VGSLVPSQYGVSTELKASLMKTEISILSKGYCCHIR